MTSRVVVFVNDLLDFAVAKRWRDDADCNRQAKRIAAFSISFVFWTSLFGAIYVVLGAPLSGLIVLVTCLPILGSLATVRCGFSPVLAGNLLCATGWATLTATAVLNGGWSSPSLLWYTTLPVVSVLTCGVSWGLLWTVIPLGSLAILAVLPTLGVEFANELPSTSTTPFAFAVLAGLVTCQFVLAWVRVGIEQRALLALQETTARLANTREALAEIELGFGFSVDEWGKLQRQKAALERFVRLRFGDVDLDEHSSAMDVTTPTSA